MESGSNWIESGDKLCDIGSTYTGASNACAHHRRNNCLRVETPGDSRDKVENNIETVVDILKP